MISTRSVTVDYVKNSNLAACLSTTGVYDASYVAASEGYLKLIERIWDEIDQKNLVSDGAALSNSQRDRRLWLLETQGFYDGETAEIRSATGRMILTRISAQRVWCSGTACDLEFFELLLGSLPQRQLVMVGDIKRKAMFAGRLRASMATMNALDQEILIRRMLSLVCEGIVLVLHQNRSSEMEKAFRAIIEPLSSFEVVNNAISTGVSYDFTSLALNELQELLLQIANEIWMIIFSCNDKQINEMLRSLVVEFAMPTPVMIR